MNTRSMYALLGIAALAVIGLLVYNQNKQQGTALEAQNQTTNSNVNANNGLSAGTSELTNINANSNSNTNTSTNNNTSGQFSDESDLDQGTVHEISYNGTAYTPSTLSIAVGDTVVFKNNSNTNFWPASAPHPQHTNYPEFDPKKAVAAGGTFEFKFLKAGEWGFHDHIRPTAFGKITVQ